MFDRRVWAAGWRRRNPERIRVHGLKYRQEHLKERRAFDRERAMRNYPLGKAYIDSLKVGGCVDCGNKNLGVLVFDHIGNKRFDVSKLWGRKFATIEAETQKCEVRCANCHQLKTNERRAA